MDATLQLFWTFTYQELQVIWENYISRGRGSMKIHDHKPHSLSPQHSLVVLLHSPKCFLLFNSSWNSYTPSSLLPSLLASNLDFQATGWMGNPSSSLHQSYTPICPCILLQEGDTAAVFQRQALSFTICTIHPLLPVPGFYFCSYSVSLLCIICFSYVTGSFP